MEFFTNINFWLLLECIGCVYGAFGFFSIFIVLYAAFKYDSSFREFLNKGLEDIEIPYPIILCLFFLMLFFAWPLILHSTLNEEEVD